jgi:UDP-N-acetylmuramoylalanine--D-glutamate ligase
MKQIAIFGIGISGLSAIDYLINNNYQILAIDDNVNSLEKLQKKYQDHPNLLQNIEICGDKTKINWNNIEFLLVSPGIPLKYPKPHDIVLLAKENSCKITGDIELFYLLNKKSKFIGITGTNGKSTVTSLTGHIFKESQVDALIGGNIGIACFELEKSDRYIFEMSSYQLDLNDKTHFHIAVIMNITPDHLDRHKDMDGYIKAKKRIFLNQTQNDFALLNIDDANCYKIYQDLKEDSNFKANLVAISLKKDQKDSISLINNRLINNISQETIDLDDFEHLKGSHNKQNIAVSYAIAHLSGISNDKITSSIKSFEGLKHRLEFVKKINNISFVNDSKATNIEAALCAIEAYDNIFWIAGGESKNDDFSILKKDLHKIKKVFLIGKDQEKIARFLNQNNVENYLCNDLDNAFKKSVEFANKEDGKIIILLSPACASFDQWKNFEERGNHFCQLVNNI